MNLIAPKRMTKKTSAADQGDLYVLMLGVKFLTLLICLIMLASCSRSVVSRDDSAEYKTAVSLPPLKKPDNPVYKAPPPDSLADEVDVSETPDSQTASETTSPRQFAVIQARIITQKNNTAIMQIDADEKSAWNYLITQLGQSGLTVHARNRKAGRLSIGCRGIEGDDSFVQSGGRSILKRKSAKQAEHCSLLVDTRRGKTIVRVVDRSGEEPSSEAASKLFERLL